jgi:hypothetical protein
MTESTDSNENDEFAGIEPAAPRRSPVMALVIMGLSSATIFHLRGDIRYALSPRQVESFEALRGAGEPVVDRYVRVHGVPDRRNSLSIEARGQKTRENFFRLLDADPPIFVRALDTAGRTDLESAWSGRLRRFADAPFAPSLRDYFARGAEVARNLELGSVHAALTSGGAEVRDRVGRAVHLPTDRTIEVEAKPTEYSLELARDRFPKEEDAQHELERVVAPFGIKVHPLASTSAEVFRFGTPMLEQYLPRRNTLFAALEKAEVEVTPAVPTYSAMRSSLRLDGDILVVSDAAVGEHRIAWSDVRAVSFREPLRVAEDGLVLSEGESPAGMLWAPLVAALLVILVAFNAWYLLRPRRAA